MSFTKHQIQHPKKQNKTRIFMAALVGFLAVNVVAAIAVKSLMNREAEDEQTPTMAAVPTEADEADDEARAHRIAGLEAMERQDYDLAVREMTAAARAGDDSPELLRLISLAQQMRNTAPAAPAAVVAPEATEVAMLENDAPPAPAAPAAAPGVSEEVEALLRRARANTPRRRRPVRRAAARPRPRPRPVAAPAPAPEPIALVVTPEPAPAEVPAPEPAPVAPAPAPAPIAASATPNPAPQPRRPAPRPQPAASQSVGSLAVSSPNVYGDVYVNGRNYGPAPRVVRDIPTGAARIEIRVDGNARRSRTVRVREGARTPVRIY